MKTLTAILVAVLLTGCSIATTMPQKKVTTSDSNGTYTGIKPIYPKNAFDQKKEGYVLLELTYDENGNFVKSRVLESQPAGYFEKSALRYAKSLEIRRNYKIPLGGEVLEQKLIFELNDK
jgi:TonB family protein